jgi:phage major head subunit gpT-like protein
MSAGGANEDYLVKRFGDKVVQSAHTEFRRRMGLQRLLLEAAWANGYSGRTFESDGESIYKMLTAAFSTNDIDGILGNTANKFLLDGFNSVETVYQRISKKRTVSDLKQITSYRMLGDFQFVEVGSSGELQHGNLGEESFTNQARTYGIMHAITRTNIINDDMGALTDVPSQIGRGAGEKINDVFWTAFAALTLTGQNASTGAFGIAGLSAAELKFLDKTYTVTVQSKSVTKPLNVKPSILLVPNALKSAAEQLIGSAGLLATGDTDATMAANNPHAGKWKVETSSYLGDSGYCDSTTEYYLLASPSAMPLLTMAYLGGVENPTFERADADFNVLGIQMRGFLDFGVGEADVRAAVKSSGE